MGILKSTLHSNLTKLVGYIKVSTFTKTSNRMSIRCLTVRSTMISHIVMGLGVLNPKYLSTTNGSRSMFSPRLHNALSKLNALILYGIVKAQDPSFLHKRIGSYYIMVQIISRLKTNNPLLYHKILYELCITRHLLKCLN